MKKKLIATVMAATMAVTALTGCGSSSASSAKKDIKVPTKPFGDTVKYDPSVEINDGKDISIDMKGHTSPYRQMALLVPLCPF